MTITPNARTRWAGRSLAIIAVIHIAFFASVTTSYWSGWLTGELYGSKDLGGASLTGFWALPGSFALPLIVLGLLIARAAKLGHELPGWVAWTLTGWVLLGSWILEPSGFPLGLISAGLLISSLRRTPAARPLASADH